MRLTFRLCATLLLLTTFTQNASAQRYATFVLDRSGSMKELRFTGMPRFNDSIDQARIDVDAFFDDVYDPRDRVSIWAVNTTPESWSHGISGNVWMTRSEAQDVLDDIEAAGWSGSTALVDTLHGAVTDMSATYPMAGLGQKFLYVYSDGEENRSIGPCCGPTNDCTDSKSAGGSQCGGGWCGISADPFDAGSWESNVCELLCEEEMTVFFYYWWAFADGPVGGQGDGVRGRAGVADEVVFKAWAATSNGVYIPVDDGNYNYPGQLPWRHYPSVSADACNFFESFEGWGGFPAPFMGINEIDSVTRLPHPDAWCNVGQRAPNSQPFQGSFCLEMGKRPGASGTNNVSNALILGLDGSGDGDLELSFMARNLGEEAHADDGVWISDDGTNWVLLYDWASLPPFSPWTLIAGIDLSNVGMNTNGNFWLRFSQQDNSAFQFGDGISVDNISVQCDPEPWLTATPFVGGANVALTVSNATPGAAVGIAYSLAGSGANLVVDPACGPVLTNLLSPLAVLAVVAADANGSATSTHAIPVAASGLKIWLQALDTADCELTNTLAELID